MNSSINDLTHEVIGASIEVHRKLGPGLLESAYRRCGYQVDILVGGVVPVEVKSVQALAPIHDAQLLTYLRLGGWRVGLLISFNVVVLKDGIHRKIMGFDN